jgi:hypothetical protein
VDVADLVLAASRIGVVTLGPQGPIDAYAIVGLLAECRATPYLRLHARIDNLFDSEYETFGILGNPGEVLGAGFGDPRFLSPGAPRGIWAGARLEF